MISSDWKLLWLPLAYSESMLYEVFEFIVWVEEFHFGLWNRCMVHSTQELFSISCSVSHPVSQIMVYWCFSLWVSQLWSMLMVRLAAVLTLQYELHMRCNSGFPFFRWNRCAVIQVRWGYQHGRFHIAYRQSSCSRHNDYYWIEKWDCGKLETHE